LSSSCFTQTRCHTNSPIHFHSPALSLSLVHPSPSTLSHTLKQEEEREGEGKEGRFGVAAARDGHGDHLEALIRKS